jgi:CRP-like cAMP-binding protein
LLKKTEFFDGMSDDALEVLCHSGRIKTVKKGEQLFAIGDQGDALYCVMSGRVVLSRVTSEGKEIALASMEKGSVFGELSLLDGQARSTDAILAESGEMFVIERTMFLQTLEQNPAIAISLLRVLSQRLRATNRLVESVSFLELGPRLARLLLILAQHEEEDAEGNIKLASKYTQSELAKYIAASRESVSKQIAKWTRDGVIELRDGCVTILDLESINFWADDVELER